MSNADQIRAQIRRNFTRITRLITARHLARMSGDAKEIAKAESHLAKAREKRAGLIALLATVAPWQVAS